MDADRRRRAVGALRASVAVAVTAAALLLAGSAGAHRLARTAATSGEPNPVLTGPITGGRHGRPWFGAPFNVADDGYSEAEYFYSGTARAYGNDSAPAHYETRMLVYRPLDAKRFSGNVIVEWDNVTAQLDAPIDFLWSYPQVLADGDAYVEITTQQAGVCGLDQTGAPVAPGTTASLCTPYSLKGYDPVRYAPLVDPGDQYADDIFSQGAQAILHPQGISPLGDLKVKTMIADGESQSAAELDDYIAGGADAAAKLFDGFLIDADAHRLPLSSYRVPTIHLWSEESAQPVASLTAPNDVIWEVTGAGHTDAWSLDQLTAEVGYNLLGAPLATATQEQADETTDGAYGQTGLNASATCAGDTQYPRRYVVDAALADLETWTRTGTPAPSAPPLQLNGVETAVDLVPPAGPVPDLPTENVKLLALGASPFTLQRDSTGTAVGGLRLPVITVPVDAYNGDDCVLLGTSTPFTAAQLHARYPTHADYVADMLTATRQAVADRYMTELDGVDLLARACASAIPSWGSTPASAQPAVCARLPGVFTAPAVAQPHRRRHRHRHRRVNRHRRVHRHRHPHRHRHRHRRAH